MTVTAVEITSHPASPAATPERPNGAAAPTSVVIVADVEALTTTNQRGCGNDNPYN